MFECSSLVLWILGFSGVMVRVLASGAVVPGFQWCNVRVLVSGALDPGFQWCNG